MFQGINDSRYGTCNPLKIVDKISVKTQKQKHISVYLGMKFRAIWQVLYTSIVKHSLVIQLIAKIWVQWFTVFKIFAVIIVPAKIMSKALWKNEIKIMSLSHGFDYSKVSLIQKFWEDYLKKNFVSVTTNSYFVY